MRTILAAALVLAGCAAQTNVERVSDNVQNACLLSVQEDGGALAQFDLATGEQHLYPVGTMPHEVEVSRNGVFAYVSQFGMRDTNHDIGAPGDHLTRIDLRNGSAFTYMLPNGARGPHGVRLRNGGGDELFTNAEIGDVMVVFDEQTGAVKRTFALPQLVHHFLFTLEGDILAFAQTNGVYKLSAEDGRVLAHADIGSSARSVYLAHSGRELLVGGRGEVVFLNVDDLSVARRFAVNGVTQIIYATIDERVRLIFAPAPGEDVVVALDLETGAERARLTPGRAPTQAVPGPDGRIFIPAVGESYITAVDTRTFAMTRVGTFQRPNGLAFGSCAQS